jgi:hypothetical protein
MVREGGGHSGVKSDGHLKQRGGDKAEYISKEKQFLQKKS